MQRLSPDALDLSALIRPGDHVIWGQGSGEPQTLTEALVAQRAKIGPMSVFLGSAYSDTLQAEHADFLHMRGYAAVGTMRRLTKAGVLNIVPCGVAMVSAYIAQGVIGCDVALVQLSPPGPDGRHSYGVINDYIRAAVAKARMVIAEINDQVPWTYGEPGPDPDQIDYFIETSRPVLAQTPQPPGATDRAIAANLAHFIEDGSTLQIGVGGTPDAVMQLVGDRKDLGVHSGLLGDGWVDLVERGVITNARKPFDTGLSVTGYLIGSKRLFDFAHLNRSLALRPHSLLNAEATLAALPKLVGVNSAVEVDLTGQVNGEQIDDDYVGAVGGQVDYTRGAHRSPGGHAIIALPATAKRDSLSRIVAKLSGPVTTARSDVDVVVTEFGCAELRGQSIPERARRMIAIAHPDFREALEQAAQPLFKRGF